LILKEGFFHMTLTLYSFLGFLILFIAIGLLSALKSKKTTHDFLLAGQSTKPWLIALSAVATNNSGYMFIGMIGYSYMIGLSSLWLLLGFWSGDLMISFLTHKKIRLITAEKNIQSYGELLGNWFGQNYTKLRFLTGLITIIFLCTYAAAQFNAGSKALHTLFQWDIQNGAIISAAVVLSYCFVGGIRASIWTDAVQSFIMIFSMLILCYVSIDVMGGITPYMEGLQQISPSYMNLFPDNPLYAPISGKILFFMGWFFGGIGVIGQPHIMVRYMSMDFPESLTRIRIYYYSWWFFFSVFTVIAGLSTRLLLPEIAGNFDAELALPLLSQKLLNPILIGVVLAGLFAATISTADSQILSSTAALTNDMGLSRNRNFYVTKFSTIFVTALAVLIALYGDESVFSLVLIAWSALSCTFAPLIIIYACGERPSEKLSIFIMVLGLLIMLTWRQMGLGLFIYEAFPGIVGALMIYVLIKLLTPKQVKLSV
jgi:sodium/proline symporter